MKIETTGATRDIETREIQKLSFGDEPADVTSARDQAIAGQFENALASLKKVNLAEIQNAAIKQEVGYYSAFCNAKLAMTAGGDKAAAIAELKAFIGQNRTTFHFFEGVQLLGDLNFADAKYADAATFYGLLGQAEWPEYKMRAAVQQARAQTAEGKYPEALAAYDQILASGLNTPEAAVQKMHATVGRAVCLAADRQARGRHHHYRRLDRQERSQRCLAVRPGIQRVGGLLRKGGQAPGRVDGLPAHGRPVFQGQRIPCGGVVSLEQALGGGQQGGSGGRSPQHVAKPVSRQSLGGHELGIGRNHTINGRKRRSHDFSCGPLPLMGSVIRI